MITVIDDDSELFEAIRHFAFCVMDATKKQGTSKTKNAAERKAAKKLLKLLGRISPKHPEETERLIDTLIP